MAERGRPPYEPTDADREVAKKLAALGTTYEDIAKKLKISSDTLVKYYKQELEEGRIDANASIAGTLFQQAKKGNTAAAIFWLKTRARWKETNVTELAAGEGAEIKGINISFVEPDGNKD
jgi:transposase